MATASDACGNRQTETEREATTAKVTLKITETGEIPITETPITTTTTTATTTIEQNLEEEEDSEVLYDSLELPDIPAAKTTTITTTTAAAATFEHNLPAATNHHQAEVEEDEEEEEEHREVDIADEQTQQYLENGKDVCTDLIDGCSNKQLTAITTTTTTIDDIPEPIKVLDDIISEFEASSDVKPAASSGENQSEDDGYMSLSRKK